MKRRTGITIWLPILLAGLLCGGGPAVDCAAQAVPGTHIDNTARVTFAAGDRTELVAASNTVSITVVSEATPSRLQLMRWTEPTRGTASLAVGTTEYSASGMPEGPWLALPPPSPTGQDPIDLTEPLTMATAERYEQGEPVFLDLEDADQNRDSDVRETVLVEIVQASGGDRELLRLLETGPATGRFTGYIQSDRSTPLQTRDGILSVAPGVQITASYVDVLDAGDVSGADAEFDPAGRVFDSQTGAAVDGARIILLDAATGLPATVLGDDGASGFPSQITSGAALLDDGGTSYDFESGCYRFPRIEPGQYVLQVLVPPGYLAPSRSDATSLQGLPGSPFFLDAGASWGEPFLYAGEGPLVVDIPLDRLDTSLLVTKTAGKASATVGDFVPFVLEVGNRSADDAIDLALTDVLPRGFRYRDGSTRIAGDKAAEPVVSRDGRQLHWDIAALPSGQDLQLRYVVEVVPGAQPGEATNEAWATWAQVSSPVARARVRITPDLFGERCTVVGRVVCTPCPEDSLAMAQPDSLSGSTPNPVGVPGVRILLETGAFAVTDAQGRYHLSGLKPGAHIVQMDLTTLPEKYEAGACLPDPHRAEHPYARMIDLQGGTLWRTNFDVHLRPPREGRIGVDLATRLDRDRLEAVATLDGQGIPLGNARLTVLLPDGVRYLPGSSSLDSLPLADPEDRGGVLIYRLGDLDNDWMRQVRFAARADSTNSRASLEIQALLVCDTPHDQNVRTPVVRTAVNLVPELRRIRQPEMVLHPRFASLSAELSPGDQADIDSLAVRLKELEITDVRIVGHSDSQRIRPGAHPVYTDNYVLSLERARAVGDRLAAQLDLDPRRVTVEGLGPDQPIAVNTTPEGRALNRRVALQVMSERTVHVLPGEPVRDHARAQMELPGLRPGETWKPAGTAAPQAESRKMPAFDAVWLASAEPGRKLLWPRPGHLPPLPTLKVAVQHRPGDVVRLELNGEAVGALAFEGVETAPDRPVALSRWSGLDLVEGDNELEVAILDADSVVVRSDQVSVHYSGPPVRVEPVPELSRTIADGKNAPVIALRLTDAEGYPVREGVIGRFEVESPYSALRNPGDEDRHSLTGLQQPRPTYRIEAGGIAYLKLEPTSQAGEVTLTVPLKEHEEPLRIWLSPQDRDWVLVGLAEGTAGYAAVSGNLEAYAQDGGEDAFYRENRLAFFAKGRLKGTWLATLAYDSRKPGPGPETNLFAVIDPDAYYTVYGDAVVEGHEAPSAEKLYVKLERAEFTALFGDFQTGLTVTELSRYQRSLTGVKSELRRRDYGYTAFVSRSHHAYRRDEIRGDGTSGLYRLSRQQLVTHSEKVTIEVRDRYRSELVLAQQSLTRTLDYEIDYAAGTIRFFEPVLSQDMDFNPRWIVVEYETWDEDEAVVSGGGRAFVRPGSGPVEAGVTAIREGESGPAGGDLIGADLRWDIDPVTRWKLEGSLTDTPVEGTHRAWMTELSRHAGVWQGRAYARELGSGFGLGQNRGGQTGTRKVGAELGWKPRAELRGDALFYRLDNRVAGAERRMAEIKWTASSQRLRANLGLRRAEDKLSDGSEKISDQLITGATLALFSHRLRLQAAREQGLGSNNDSVDFPTRSTLGLELEALRNQVLTLSQEWVHGQPDNRRNTRLGLKTVPWTGGQVTSSRQVAVSENTERVFSAMGFKQDWRLSEAWSLDGAIEHGWSDSTPGTADNDSTSAADLSPFGSTATTGGEDFTAVSLGAAHRGQGWLWDQRAEYRNGWTEDKWGLYGGIFVEPTGSTGMLFSVKLQGREARTGGHDKNLDVGLGLAWRPEQSAWLLLQKLNFRTLDTRSDTFGEENWRLVQNLNLTWNPRRWLQVSTLYGARFQREFVTDATYESFTDRTGLEARTFFRRRWDAGLRTSWLHGWTAGVSEWSSGLSCGYKLLEDVWLSVGYNFTGYVDRDLGAGEYTAHGPYFRFRVRFNQESTREMPR